MSDLRTAAQQALAFTMRDFASLRDFEAAKAVLHDNLRAALAQQAEPVAGTVVAWGVFANIDGEWQLQHPVFAGDEQGKVNAEFERASYSGPQPLEVRPLGVVTATAQQAEQQPMHPELRKMWEDHFDKCFRAIPVPEQAEPDAYGYASRLAVAIWEKHYKDTAPDWKPLDDLMGVLTQIDNMTSGLTRLAQQAEPVEPVAWAAVTENGKLYKAASTRESAERKAEQQGAKFGDTWRPLHVVPLYTAPPQRKPLTVQEPAYKVKVTGRWHDTEPLAAAFNLPDGEHLLYTAPPRRTMVPLTEEEIDAEWRELDGEVSTMFMRVLRKFARAVEKASWEKNHGQV